MSNLRRRRRAFTLVELLVVIAVIAILAALLLPVLSKAKVKAQAVYCMNNTRQLVVAWLMYAHDNNDVLVQNQNLGAPGLAEGSWITGFLNWTTASDNTNLAFLLDPKYARLAGYMGQPRNIYKCPADHFVSAVQRQAGWRERVRSLSMNFYMGEGSTPGDKDWSADRVVYKKYSQIRKTPPCNAWVFVDEHPDSINDGAFYTETSAPRWVDMPASYHDRACGFAFADGHSEIKHWSVPRTAVPLRYVDWNMVGFDASGDRRDIVWLQERTSEGP